VTDERWLPIPGFEGLYEVSDQGRVWSCPGKHKRGGFRKLRVGTDKHLYVKLCNGPVRRMSSVHGLVLTAFVGPRPPGVEACHFPDPNPANNALNNLRWDTREANLADAIKQGIQFRYRRKYDYAEIKRLHAAGVSQKEISRLTGASISHLWKVISGWNWRRTGVPL
jgi:hypothetical protein